MPTSTYNPISTTTLTNTSTSINFTGFSNSFTDLRIVIAGTLGATQFADILVRFNDDSNINYDSIFFYGNGSVVQAGSVTNNGGANTGYMGQNASVSILDIMGYTSNIWKTVAGRNSAQGGASYLKFGVWRNTNAITKITLLPIGSEAWAVGTTFTLFAITREP